MTIDAAQDPAQWAREAVAKGWGVSVAVLTGEPQPTISVDNPATPETETEAWWLVHHDRKSGRATYVAPRYLRLQPGPAQVVEVPAPEKPAEAEPVTKRQPLVSVHLDPFRQADETDAQVHARLSAEFTALQTKVGNGMATLAEQERHEVLYGVLMQVRG